MEKDKLLDIINDVENKSNKDLLSSSEILQEEFEKTKQLIIDLTRHMDTVEIYYEKILKELENRKNI
jgi:hypothetical protein